MPWQRLCYYRASRWRRPAGSNAGSRTSGLPAVIPIFPLESPTLFPNGTFPLHIFEPRYRAMIADALKGDRIIGMVMLQPGRMSRSTKDGRRSFRLDAPA